MARISMDGKELAFFWLVQIWLYGWVNPLKTALGLSIRTMCIAYFTEEKSGYYCLLDTEQSWDRFGYKISSRKRLMLPDMLLTELSLEHAFKGVDPALIAEFRPLVPRLRELAQKKEAITIDDLDGSTPAGPWFTHGYDTLRQLAAIYTAQAKAA